MPLAHTLPSRPPPPPRGFEYLKSSDGKPPELYARGKEKVCGWCLQQEVWLWGFLLAPLRSYFWGGGRCWGTLKLSVLRHRWYFISLNFVSQLSVSSGLAWDYSCNCNYITAHLWLEGPRWYHSHVWQLVLTLGWGALAPLRVASLSYSRVPWVFA